MTRLHRLLPRHHGWLPLVALFALIALPNAIEAQEDEDPCAAALSSLEEALQESWDDLSMLTWMAGEFPAMIQDQLDHYSPEALADMSRDEVEEAKAELRTLQRCLPRLAGVLDRLKKRIEELGSTPNVSTNADRDQERHRQRAVREAEQIHGEVTSMLRLLIGTSR